jgi:hypothetical protein
MMKFQARKRLYVDQEIDFESVGSIVGTLLRVRKLRYEQTPSDRGQLCMCTESAVVMA